ncbi:hypothetical protein Droror1_Dr00020723 [Drosera rotundifolia]
MAPTSSSYALSNRLIKPFSLCVLLRWVPSLPGSSQVLRESSISVVACVLIVALGPIQFEFTSDWDFSAVRGAVAEAVSPGFRLGSSDSSSLSANVAGLIDGASKHRDGVSVDCLPVNVKELIAGGASGGFAKTAVAPLERIKILFQTRTEGLRSLGVCGSFKKLTEQEGVQGLDKGDGASILRIVPYAALFLLGDVLTLQTL